VLVPGVGVGKGNGCGFASTDTNTRNQHRFCNTATARQAHPNAGLLDHFSLARSGAKLA
jgi:hypothetical protein